jgi:hypothetical protein
VLYLTVVPGQFNRELVRWSIVQSMTADLVTDLLADGMVPPLAYTVRTVPSGLG